MKKSQPVHMPLEAYEAVKKFSASKGLKVGDAAGFLIAYAMKRMAALAKDQAKRKKSA